MIRLMLIILLVLVLFCLYHIAQVIIEHFRDKEGSDDCKRLSGDASNPPQGRMIESEQFQEMTHPQRSGYMYLFRCY